MAEWYEEASKYRGKNSTPDLGDQSVDRVYGVPKTRPFLVPPNNKNFRDTWQIDPCGRGKQQPPSGKKK